MNDRIYRNEAIEVCEKWRQRAKEHQDRDGWYMADILLRFMKEMPSANGPQEWIPCSERLPKAKITAPCFMTIIYPRAGSVGVAYGYRYHKDVWVYVTPEGEEYTKKGIAEVVAWMPLPKPWKRSK